VKTAAPAAPAPLVVGLAGGTASGKTWLARHLAENFPDTTVFPASPPHPSSHERPIPQF
jgi:uridine kinase